MRSRERAPGWQVQQGPLRKRTQPTLLRTAWDTGTSGCRGITTPADSATANTALDVAAQRSHGQRPPAPGNGAERQSNSGSDGIGMRCCAEAYRGELVHEVRGVLDGFATEHLLALLPLRVVRRDRSRLHSEQASAGPMRCAQALQAGHGLLAGRPATRDQDCAMTARGRTDLRLRLDACTLGE